MPIVHIVLVGSLLELTPPNLWERRREQGYYGRTKIPLQLSDLFKNIPACDLVSLMENLPPSSTQISAWDCETTIDLQTEWFLEPDFMN